MAEYDGSIRIKTEIDSKNASAQLMSLENRITKTADKVASLRSKMESLKDTKIPTQEYKEISDQIEKAEQMFNKLLDKQEQMQREGKDNGVAWKRLNDQMDEVGNEIRYAKGELKDLVDTGKAFTLGSDTQKYSDYGKQLKYAENEMSVLTQKHEILHLKQNNNINAYKKIGKVAKTSLEKVHSILNKTNNSLKSFGVWIKNVAQKHLPSLKKQTEKASGSLSKFGTRLKSLLSGIFIFNVIRSGFRHMFSAIKEGYENLYSDNKKFEDSVNNLKASALTLKNAFAAAFSPLVQIAIPYIQRAIELLTKLADSVGQFIAAVTGQKTYLRAIKQTTAAIKEETNATDKQLSSLDKLNNLTSSKDSDDEQNFGTMFEDVPVSDEFSKFADKVKDILSKLFEPLKEAWDREGKFVMDSWKYALDEIWKLIKDIGRDFLEVWNQPETVDMLADILHIIGDIGLVVGHLARNFREAWNENKTGLHILENIRDIFAVIIANILHAADATVEWADKLDFGPLLQAFERFTESLIPVADSLSGILTDFYEKVLLPLGTWTIEKGLPELLDVFTAFNEKVDWDALRSNIAEFWEHLEPFAETVGEGLIIFIERVADALANFLNSQEFKDFLVSIEKWMDSVTPEDVADALENIAKAIIALKLATIGFNAGSKLLSFLSDLAIALKVFGGGGLFSTVAGWLKSIGVAIAGWAPHIVVATAIAGVLSKIKEIMESEFDTSNWNVLDWISNTLETSLNGWKSQFEGFKISLELWWQDTWMSDAIWRFGQWWSEKIAPWFTKEKWSELWSNVKQAAIEKWSEIKQIILDKVSEIRTNISNKLTNIKTDWNSAWNNLKTKVQSVTGEIKSTVKSALEWIEQKINSMKSKFNEFKSGIGGFFSGSSGTSTRISSYSYSPAVAALSNMDIPGYATGQVIPRTMKQHLAILGDNNSETEVVSPLSTIEQAVENVMSRNNAAGGEITIKIPVEIDGNVLFELVKKYSNEQFKRTGKPAFS